jgi:hypothetical protein
MLRLVSAKPHHLGEVFSICMRGRKLSLSVVEWLAVMLNSLCYAGRHLHRGIHLQSSNSSPPALPRPFMRCALYHSDTAWKRRYLLIISLEMQDTSSSHKVLSNTGQAGANVAGVGADANAINQCVQHNLTEHQPVF